MYKKYLIVVLIVFISFCPFSMFYGCSDKKASDVKSKLVAKKIKPIKGSETSESKEKPSNLAADKADQKGNAGEGMSTTDSQSVSKD